MQHMKVEMHHTAGTYEISWAFITKKLKKLIHIYIHTHIYEQVHMKQVGQFVTKKLKKP